MNNKDKELLNPLKICIGLVVKGGKQFINKWIESAERCGDCIVVVDNDADEEVRNKLINHLMVKHYHIQKYPNRNMSRDYQKILDYAREEKCQWCWIMDMDKFVPEFDVDNLKALLMDTKDQSVGFPLFECRNDFDHYVMIKDKDGTMKHARLAHEMYKVLSHFAYDVSDEHSGVIPQNCTPGDAFIWTPIHHYGHMTKELREEKRQKYIKDKEEYNYDDKGELVSTWMSENESEIEVRPFKELNIIQKNKNE